MGNISRLAAIALNVVLEASLSDTVKYADGLLVVLHAAEAVFGDAVKHLHDTLAGSLGHAELSEGKVNRHNNEAVGDNNEVLCDPVGLTLLKVSTNEDVEGKVSVHEAKVKTNIVLGLLSRGAGSDLLEDLKAAVGSSVSGTMKNISLLKVGDHDTTPLSELLNGNVHEVVLAEKLLRTGVDKELKVLGVLKDLLRPLRVGNEVSLHGEDLEGGDAVRCKLAEVLPEASWVGNHGEDITKEGKGEPVGGSLCLQTLEVVANHIKGHKDNDDGRKLAKHRARLGHDSHFA
mmetsp:Transcript_12848/g.24939  ORF Transcript_12848/g.24939 Transcript_12848/m.24939 type:complete len:289 (+) Transcript_12848:1196-2062(+)